MKQNNVFHYFTLQGELRAAPDDEGVIEGYATVWNTIDAYNSSFQRGCFTKTLQERGSRVRLLWNHEETVIGKPLELREDDRGLWVRAKLVLSVPKAQEVYELIKAGAIDTFSFGFRTIKDKWVDGVRVITEVALFEVSPVIFEANSAAAITGVRNMPTPTDIEKRNQDYLATYSAYEIGRRGDLILSALYRTLDDIWYSDLQGEEVRSKVDGALTQFGDMYRAYTDDLLGMQKRSVSDNVVKNETRKYLTENGLTAETLAATTVLTLDEVRSLQAGQPAVETSKLSLLPEGLRKAIAAHRASKVEQLCSELRQGLEEPEVTRIRGLLGEPEALSNADAIIDALTNIRGSFKS